MIMTEMVHDARIIPVDGRAHLAKSIRQGRALPAWLHQATCRIAAKLRCWQGSSR